MLTTKLSIGIAAAMLASVANAQPVVTVRDLDRFTHEALIPAGSDLSSIRLDRVKLVRIPTRIRSTMMTSYCDEEQTFRDPGGSLYCPNTKLEALAQAYEVTYSYTGQPLTSDEYGGRYFTFSVYFRPEELNEAARGRIFRGKIRRGDVEGLFDVRTSRATAPRAVIDQERAKFCAGNYIDVSWVQADPGCKDDVKSRTVIAAADYVTVRVDTSLTRVSSR
jgi:hypothetical protein